MSDVIAYRDELITLYHGDARTLFDSRIPECSLEAVVVTDPPYGIEVVKNRKMPGAQQFADMHGDDTTDLVRWIIEAWYPRSMLLFGANNFPHLLPEKGVWSCWDKRCSENADRMFGSPFELAWQTSSLGKRFKMYRVQHGGVVNADGHGVQRVHPTQKPVVLMERILRDIPGDIVIDPFAGSASTLIAARNLGRRSIGYEIAAEHCVRAVERLQATAL